MYLGLSNMVTMMTLGGSGKERSASRVSTALWKGSCTCMTTTSGSSSRASLRASASLGTSATTSMPPPVGGEQGGQALPEHGVVVGQQHPDDRVARFCGSHHPLSSRR